MSGRKGGAFIQDHGDGGVELVLQVHADGRRQPMTAAVDMGLEGHAVPVDFPQRGQRHDLEAPGVGQDGARPVHEAMQAAQARDPVGAGPQHQMVGVTEDALACRLSGPHRRSSP